MKEKIVLTFCFQRYKIILQMTKEQREKHKEDLQIIAKKIGQIDDMELKGIARAFILGYTEGRNVGIRVGQQKQTA